MIQFISLDSCELGSEFVNDESISPILIFMTEKQRVTQVNRVGGKGGNREDNFYGRNNVHINILAKENSRLTQIRCLP
jgi:hypothetical protein